MAMKSCVDCGLYVEVETEAVPMQWYGECVCIVCGGRRRASGQAQSVEAVAVAVEVQDDEAKREEIRDIRARRCLQMQIAHFNRGGKLESLARRNVEKLSIELAAKGDLSTVLEEEEVPVVEAPKVEAKRKSRCPHLAEIKAFFAVAREVGLDAQAKDRCRGAVGVFLGRRISSRADLSGAEWAYCANAVRLGRLFW
jgi:hypothetical protein